MDIKRIGIIGAGNMGSGIAQKAAQEGFEVILMDIKDEFVERGIANIRKTLDEGVQRKIFPEKVAQEVIRRISRAA